MLTLLKMVHPLAVVQWSGLWKEQFIVHFVSRIYKIDWRMADRCLTRLLDIDYFPCIMHRIIVFSISRHIRASAHAPLTLGREPRWQHFDILWRAMENRGFHQIKKFLRSITPKNKLHNFREKNFGARCLTLTMVTVCPIDLLSRVYRTHLLVYRCAEETT